MFQTEKTKRNKNELKKTMGLQGKNTARASVLANSKTFRRKKINGFPASQKKNNVPTSAPWSFRIDPKELFKDYLGWEVGDKQKLGKTYGSFTKILRRITRTKIFLKKSSWLTAKYSLKLAYTSGIFALIIFLLYGSFPVALMAPQSVSVTAKAEWNQGTLNSVTSETHGANIDSIQLEPEGSWTARVWATPPDTISFGHTSVMAGDYLYVFRGYSDNAFWRYDTANNTWEELEDLPQPAHYGADMTYLDTQGKIYAIFGGYSQKFYSYDIEEDSWTQLSDLLDTPYTGASMETDGESIFVIRGNTTTTFWKYSASEASPSWSGLDPVPGGATVNTGGDLVNGHDGHLYLVRGGNTLNFYRYDLSSRDWETNIASIPAGYQMNGEQKGAYWTDGSTKYLYFFRSANTAHFLRYQINGTGANTWTVLSASEAIPATTNYTSLNLNETDGNLYAIRGNGSYDVWKYDPDGTAGQQWVGPKTVQDASGNAITVGTGSDLIWNGADYVYAIRGNNTTGVYRYQISANAWTNCTAFSGFNINSDVKGTYNGGNMYFLRPGTTGVYYSDCTSAWSALADTLPLASGNGGAIVYNSGDSRYYVLRGGGQANLYYSTGGAWGTATNMSVTDGGTTVTYYANIGARMVSNGTNLYAMVGDGETAFLRYNTGGAEANTWTKLDSTPFSQYYGTDMAYDSTNQKIYAIAGYYKDETWEYSIADDIWRRLSDNQQYVFGRGPYNGASLEYAGGSSLYATSGQGLTDLWSYTVGSSNYPSLGIYESQSIDLVDVDENGWVSFTTTYDEPDNTSIIYETMTSSDGESWPETWDAVTEVSKEDGVYTGTIESDENRYIKVRATLATSNGVSTPTLKDYTVSFNIDADPPTNPAAVSGYSQQTGGVTLTSDQEYDYEHPYFSWIGATDNGAGIDGYWVCFGKSDECSDPEADGIYQTGSTYTVNSAMEFDNGETFGTYYLKILTQDNNGTVATAEPASFTYKYSGVSPYQSVEKSTEDDFSAGTTTNTSIISYGSGAVRLQSATGFWNQSRLSLEPAAVTAGAELALGTCQGTSDHCLYTFRGVSAAPYTQFQYYDIETDIWGTRTATLAAVGAGGSITEGSEGYLYAVRGGGNSDFWLYNIAENSWSALEGVPAQVNYGSHLSYDGSRYVYLMPGNDDALFKFDTCNGESGGCTQEWTQLANANFDNPNPSDGQRLYEGADGIYDGRNNIFVTQGNYYPYFAKYSIAADAEYDETANTWTPLAQAPVGFYNGGSMAYDSDTENIFALAGNARMKFYKYNINSNEWTELPDAPATISSSASMVVHDDYIYIQRGGNTTNFYRFNIEENSWELPTRGFFGPETTGGTTGWPYGSYFYYGNGTYVTPDDDDALYVIRGLYDNTFGRYNPSTGTFTELAKLPVGAYTGANIVYVEDEGTQGSVFYVPGAVRTVRASNNNYFFKYDIATNIWTEITGTRPDAQTNYGSSMVYDGSQYIYLTRGGNTGTWWRFDISTDTWSSALPTATITQQDGAKMVFVENGANDKIYATRGGGNTTFYQCDLTQLPGSNCWSAVGTSLPAGIGSGGSLMDGGDDYLYTVRGGNTNNYYRWPKAGGAWETTPTIPTIPANVTNGGSGTNLSSRNWTTAGYVANTSYSDGLYSYVVGSSSSGTGFEKTGTYTSEAIDLTAVYQWANLTATYALPDNTFLTIETRTTDDSMECEDAACENKDWSGWVAASNDHVDDTAHIMNINSTPKQYIQIRFSYTSSDRIYSPRLDDFTVNYYQDTEEPTGPTSVTAYSAIGATPAITNPTGDSWFGHTAPYFTWPAVGEAGGASDNAGGSGIAGYYVCFGESADCTDAYADGDFQTGNNFTVPALATDADDYTNNGKTYYLRIAAVDNAGWPSETYTAFTYNFDNNAPSDPATVTVRPTGYSSNAFFTMEWSDDASDDYSGVDKLQYRLGNEPSTTWHNIASGTFSQEVEPYQSNENTFLLRTVDNAGNATSGTPKYYYYSGGAASPPTDLVANPNDEYNLTNSFTFTWDTPESYAGDPGQIKYYYSVNVAPTAYNTTETTAKAAGPGPFATQYGKNTFYVVAMSEGGVKTNPGDVDWENPAEVDFYAQTTAPGPPLNLQIFDTSDKEAQEFSLALKWGVPSSYDSGNFAGYSIYRSDTADGTFVEVATTTGTAYVDTELESREYYYHVKSRDRTNNYSVATSTVDLIPTGRYTSPPTIVTEPAVSVESFAATMTWSTNRACSSFVEYGTSSSMDKTNGQVDSVTAHTVALEGLSAATKYYYRAKFIDPDGNIGTSDVLSFTTNDPPTISDVATSDIGLNSANISWTTNISGTCTLKYGKGSLTSTAEESAGGTSHIQKLSALESSSSYSYQIDCLDADSNSFSSDQYTFTTLEQAQATDFAVQNKMDVNIPTIEVTYKTTHNTTTLVKFKGANESSHHNYLLSEQAMEHTATIEGLDPAVEYEVIATGIDENGIEASSQTAKVTTLTDSRPPTIITNRAVGKVIGRGKDARANLYVKIETDEESTAKVLFGKGTILNNFEQSTAEDAANTYHLITIPVDPGQVYSYIMEINDLARNKNTSKAVTVVVEEAKENATEIVVNTFSSKFGWLSKLLSQ